MAFTRSPRGVWRRAVNQTMTVLATLCAAAAIGALVLVLAYLVIHGIGALHLSTFTLGPVPMGELGGGLRNGIVGTLVLLALASLIGLPFGVLGGIYQAESKGKLLEAVRFFTDVLNSVPSVIIGVFVYVAVVRPIGERNPGHGYSAMAGGIALGILMIPTVMRTTEEMIRLVPIGLRDASLALGAARWRTMWSVILPAARGGIVTGAMLALARTAGETAPLLFTAFGNLSFNVRLDQPIQALPLDIFQDVMTPYDNLHRLALAGSIILIVLVLVISLLARFATRKSFSQRG